MKVLKLLNVVIIALALFTIAGCATSSRKLNLCQQELDELKSKNNITLSDSLKQRLIENSNELRLTPEEMQVLKATGKVILCGECGYILNTLKYKEYEAKNKSPNVGAKTEFEKDSIRSRIISLTAE